MAKSEKRAKSLAMKRSNKEAQFKAAMARGDVGGRSKYAQKIQRKMGRGRVDPSWMWWLDAGNRIGSIATDNGV